MRSTFTQCYVYIRPIDFLHEVFLVSILNHGRSILQSISFRTSYSQNRHSSKDSVQYALDIRLKLSQEDTQALLIVIINLGATQHSLGDFQAALGSYQHALLLICLEKNKNALLTVLMALH